MKNSLNDKKIARTLERLYQDRAGLGETLGMIKIFLRRLVGKPVSDDDFATAYLAVPRDKGEFLYVLLRAVQARNIVEFGTSFGISTIYLAAGARDNGGSVITSEMVAAKYKTAAANFKEAGVDDIVTILKGDALTTLRSVKKSINFLFLDGWKNNYLPILKILEPRFKKGTLIVADNAKMKDVAPYIEYLRSTPKKYTTHFIDKSFGGMEVSCYIGS